MSEPGQKKKSLVVKGSGDFPNIPPATLGAHNAVCCEVYDRGVVKDSTWGDKRKGWLVFQLEEVIQGTGTDFDGMRREVRYSFNLTGLGPKSTIRKALESWRGGPLLQEEIDDGFDLAVLEGVSALVVIGSHSQPDQNGRVYANISGINPPQKKLDPLDYVPIDERKQQQATGGTTTGSGAGETEGVTDKVPF